MTDIAVAIVIGVITAGTYLLGYFSGKGQGRMDELKRQAKKLDAGTITLEQATRDSIMADMLIHDPYPLRTHDWE